MQVRNKLPDSILGRLFLFTDMDLVTECKQSWTTRVANNFTSYKLPYTFREEPGSSLLRQRLDRLFRNYLSSKSEEDWGTSDILLKRSVSNWNSQNFCPRPQQLWSHICFNSYFFYANREPLWMVGFSINVTSLYWFHLTLRLLTNCRNQEK